MNCPHCGKEILFSDAPTKSERAVETYYRRRAAGVRVRLRQIAEETGMSHSWLRQVKVEYDRAGKWGSAGSGKVVRRDYHKKATP